MAAMLLLGAILATNTGIARAQWGAPDVPGAAPTGAYPATTLQPAIDQQELDRLLAPIALYPDAILSQLLMASAFPGDIAAAAGWARRHPVPAGPEAAAEARGQSWHPAVMSLLSTPQLLWLMDEYRDWTRALGAAMLEREPLVLETIQALRRRAQAAGMLPAELGPTAQGQDILIGAAEPAWVQLPWYDPLIVYGPWWWPATPVRWPMWRWAGVQRFSAGFVASAPLVLPRHLPWGRLDWHARRINMVRVHFIAGQPAYRSQTHWHQGAQSGEPVLSSAWPSGTSTAWQPGGVPAIRHPRASSVDVSPRPGQATALPGTDLRPPRHVIQVPPATSSAYAGMPVSSAHVPPPVHAHGPLAVRPVVFPPGPARGLSAPVVPTLTNPVVSPSPTGTPVAAPLGSANPPARSLMRAPSENHAPQGGHPGSGRRSLMC